MFTTLSCYVLLSSETVTDHSFNRKLFVLMLQNLCLGMRYKMHTVSLIQNQATVIVLITQVLYSVILVIHKSVDFYLFFYFISFIKNIYNSELTNIRICT